MLKSYKITAKKLLGLNDIVYYLQNIYTIFAQYLHNICILFAQYLYNICMIIAHYKTIFIQ